MVAVAARPRVAKAKPAPATSPVADILARIDTVEYALAVALDAADEGSDLAVLIFGILDTLIPLAVPPLYRAPVSKADVDETYRELFFPLSVLKAALMMSKGLVMEGKLQQAFEILDRAHTDMDSALVQDWPIPDQAPAPTRVDGPSKTHSSDTAGEPAEIESVLDLPSAVRDRMDLDLHMAGATVQLMITVFAGEGPAEPKKCAGLMGSMQYMTATLAQCKESLQDAGGPLDRFYFGVFHAASLAEMLDALLWADAWNWSLPASTYCDAFSAIKSEVDAAILVLNKAGAP